MELTTSTFDQAVSDNENILVKFYAPWCGHCQTLAPEYEEAALALKKENIPLAKLDCTDNMEICTENGIQGYPTVKLYRSGVPVDYDDLRSSSAIISWMKKMTGPAAIEVSHSSDLQELLSSSNSVDRAMIGVFDDFESEEAKAFKNVANSLRNSFLFIISSNPQLFETELEMESNGPTIICIPTDLESGSSRLFSSEDFSEKSILEFIKMEAFPLIAPINGRNFEAYLARELPFLWAFVEPEEIEKGSIEGSTLKTLETVAESFKGLLSFVYVDGVQYQEYMESLGLSNELPAIVIETFEEGSRFILKQSFSESTLNDFVSQFTSGELSPFVKSAPVPENNDGPVKVIVGSTFDAIVSDSNKTVLVAFYAPWCPHCQSLEPTLETLAEEIMENDEIVIAKMDVTENDSPITVEGLPTVVLFVPGFEDGIQYEGDRTLESLKEFVHFARSEEFEEADALEEEAVSKEMVKDEL